MRFRIPIMAGLLVLAALVSGGDGGAATFEDLQKETAATPSQAWSWDIRVPMIFSGTTLMFLTEVCVSGDSVRPMDPSKASMDMGRVRPGNQYSVGVHKCFDSGTGDYLFMYQRAVELPACK